MVFVAAAVIGAGIEPFYSTSVCVLPAGIGLLLLALALVGLVFLKWQQPGTSGNSA
ncbi:MAG: hypothetical protein ACLVB1_01950 [Blautia obeum]